MSMLSARKNIIRLLWRDYLNTCPVIQKIIRALQTENKTLVLDHLAIIDLPNYNTANHTGIAVFNQLWSVLHYTPAGRDYLSQKQNEFLWLAPIEACTQTAEEADPQIVLADFCLADMHPIVQKIILKYARQAPAIDWRYFHTLCGAVFRGDFTAETKLVDFIYTYCQQRPWALPTLKEYLTVKEHNELLAWVLVFGRCVNHFGINVRFLKNATSLESFSSFMQEKLSVKFNTRQGLIKGNADKFIAQSATEGEIMPVFLHNSQIFLARAFIEFVWRAPNNGNSKIQPIQWRDYFTGFIAEQADSVIESVFK